MSVEIKTGIDARDRITKGINKLADAVKTTLGAKGRNALIEREGLDPLITNDGVTIAKAIELEDKFEKLGSDFVKESAIRTNKKAGDGTTTAIVLTQAIWEKIRENEINPMILKKFMQKASDDIVEELKKMSVPVETTEDIKKIATISANNDPEIGKIIADAIDQIGMQGVIEVEEANQYETTVEINKGMQFDEGFISRHLVNGKKEVSKDEGFILVTDKKINEIEKLIPIFEYVGNKPLTLICKDMSEKVLSDIIVYKMQGKIDILISKLPGYGMRKEELAQDIANVTGGKAFLDGIHQSIDQTFLGTGKVKMNNKSTTVINKNDTKEKQEYIEKLKLDLEEETSDFLKDKIRKRIARLTSGVAIIKVGANTETEAREKELRIEDAIHSTKSAIESGILAGGGVALINVQKKLQGKYNEYDGYQAVLESLKIPQKQVLENAGINPNVTAKFSGNKGINVLDESIVDMYEAGIIDPAKVEISALENAVSVTSMLITTETTLAINRNNS